MDRWIVFCSNDVGPCYAPSWDIVIPTVFVVYLLGAIISYLITTRKKYTSIENIMDEKEKFIYDTRQKLLDMNIDIPKIRKYNFSNEEYKKYEDLVLLRQLNGKLYKEEEIINMIQEAHANMGKFLTQVEDGEKERYFKHVIYSTFFWFTILPKVACISLAEQISKFSNNMKEHLWNKANNIYEEKEVEQVEVRGESQGYRFRAPTTMKERTGKSFEERCVEAEDFKSLKKKQEEAYYDLIELANDNDQDKVGNNISIV